MWHCLKFSHVTVYKLNGEFEFIEQFNEIQINYKMFLPLTDYL